MLVRLTYVLVIIIWATTPLAIKLGGDSLEPLASLSLRIALAFGVGCVLSTLAGWQGLMVRRHWQLYLAASLSLFPNMALVYWAATYLPSGLISLLFALAPFFTLLLAGPILGESTLSPRKVAALVLALSGLGVLLVGDEGLPPGSGRGILLMLGANGVFSFSALWVKRLNARFAVPPVEQALGAMAFALPGMGLCWWLTSVGAPLSVSAISLASLLYLAIFGSLVGFVAYYSILRQLSVESVSLIPLITPVMAIALGAMIMGESISVRMLLGASMILIALALHQGVLGRLHGVKPGPQ